MFQSIYAPPRRRPTPMKPRLEPNLEKASQKNIRPNDPWEKLPSALPEVQLRVEHRCNRPAFYQDASDETAPCDETVHLACVRRLLRPRALDAKAPMKGLYPDSSDSGRPAFAEKPLRQGIHSPSNYAMDVLRAHSYDMAPDIRQAQS